ncbi:multidrug effflux MFS transporter [Sphingomonas sp. KRR8]|uniref:multidrug effflux MFS transporter n=1 Tax=Sphingomonas sp. KRR8 TaxID=2942996 RepID=UPI002020DFAA|nr:multidrug effflux MFS transporter [Sphingomonas sp. KRR8]URD61299.1 multidrug effflux MFS transporter [Sphingomonas sp. KRR8]
MPFTLHHLPGSGPRPGAREMVALLAALMALNAIAIDSMIPALPDIGAHLHVTEENRRQLIIVIYMLGFGFGQLLWGPLADRFGRKPILTAGITAYAVFASLCSIAPSFEVLIAGRLLQGASAAVTRVLVVAMVRDLFEGEAMARVMSLTFMVFMLVPVLAPSFGQAILAIGPWQAIFWALAGYGVLLGVWSYLRLPETLHAEYRRSLKLGELWEAARKVLSERQSLGYTLAQTAFFSGLVAYISSIQQIVFDTFDAASRIGVVFGAVAAPMALAAFINSRFVGRLGLRRVGHLGVVAFVVITSLHALAAMLWSEGLGEFVVLQGLTMASFAFTSSNLNTLAMEKMAPIAGMASSIQGLASTVLASAAGFAIGQSFDGTQRPFLIGLAVCGWVGALLVVLTDRKRLFERLPKRAGGARVVAAE